MNNKGQSLVLFILIIPILIGILALVIDVGKVFNVKSNQENTLELILEYNLEDLQEDSFQEQKVTDLVNKNLPQNKNNIEIENNTITISTQEEVEGIFSKLFGFDEFTVITKLTGYLEENKVKIKKIK